MKRDGTPQPGERCLMCGQVIPPKQGRTCGRCEKPIRRHDKFYFQGSMVFHRNCEHTQRYGFEAESTASAPEATEALCEADSTQAPAAKAAEDSNSPLGTGDGESSPGGLGEGRATVRCVPEASSAGW